MALVVVVGLRIWIVVHFVVVVETAELELAVAEYSEADTVHHAVVADMVAVDV